jgi:hypothetical protein
VAGRYACSSGVRRPPGEDEVMSTTTDEIAAAQAQITDAQTALSDSTRARDALIKSAKGTIGATELAKLTGLTRGRIYQIWES